MARTRFIVALLAAVTASALAAAWLFSRYQEQDRAEKTVLAKRGEALAGRLQAARAVEDALRAETVRLTARLAEATNSTVTLSAGQETQLTQHQKLRNEIARLSAETIGQETQLAQLRDALAAGKQAQARAEEAYRLAQSQATAFSNETVRLRKAEAGTAARLAARERELAENAAALTARAAELAAAQAAARQADAQKTAAEQNVQAIQAKLDAAQAELAALKPKPAAP